MQKFTLSHIGAVSLGRLLAVWSFVLGAVSLLLYTVLMMFATLFGLAAGTDFATTFMALIMGLIMGVLALVGFAIGMFIFGFLSAVIYNIILGVGGGIDFDCRERKNE